MAALGAIFDAVDLKYRVEVGETHNINALLADYQTRTLVMHIENDQWLTVDKARESVALIPGAQIITETSPIAHYATFSAINDLRNDPMVTAFLHDIGIEQTPGKVCDAPNYTSPRVNMNPDPETSFWLDNLVPPFPVKFTDVTDESGVEWEIGYMDEVCEGIENPETLVIVHGKGAFGAHYGYLMKFAVEQGYRVIAMDMPHSGFSGPGNVGKNPARTFEDMRSAFHGVLVDQLGIETAWYLGHSLGGQFVLGYALKYPEAVKGLVLEAPAGLEQFPKTMLIGDVELPVFDPAIGRDFEAWQAAWDPTGAFEAEFNRTEQGVRDFFHFIERDPVTGAAMPSRFGYFKNDTEYARLHTDQRVAMITGNPEEFEQWVTAFIYDIYTIGMELNEGDPDSLYSRLTDIDVPIFVAPDSADVWAFRSNFQIDEAGRLKALAGVPPDYFSAEGQLWGNPLFDWESMGKEEYAWWRRRLEAILNQVDWVRIDHFRAFQAYWRIPAEAEKVRFGVVHVGCPEVVPAVKEGLRQRFGAVETLTAPATPVISTHLGTGAWGVAYMVED